MSEQISVQAKLAGFETFRHIEQVRNLLSDCATDLLNRAKLHDQSKLVPPEAEGFAEFTAKLAGTTYGSDAYREFLTQMKPFLDHHYAKNRHHPEHFPNGINDMTLMDLLEMFCDWKAATLRHNDGNLMRSIDVNSKRFAIDAQLRRVFENTAAAFEGAAE